MSFSETWHCYSGAFPSWQECVSTSPCCSLDIDPAKHLLGSGLGVCAVHVLSAKKTIICLPLLDWRVVTAQSLARWALLLAGCSLH